MNARTDEEIRAKVDELWADKWADSPNLAIERAPGTIRLTVTRMYETIDLSFQKLMALSEFFGTQNIEDEARISNGGCETCDYGSRYGHTLIIKREER